MKKFECDETGSVIPVFAVSLLAIVGLVGFAVSIGFDTRTLNRLQADADAAALAGAIAYMNDSFSKTEKQRIASAKLAATQNAESVLWAENSTIDVAVDPVGGFGQSAQVRVTLSAKPTNRLATWAGGPASAMRSETAIAEVTKGLPLCMLTLASLGSGFEMDGGGVFHAQECVVWANSTGLQSMAFSGSGNAVAEVFCSAGTPDVSPGYSVTPAPTGQCARLPDPLASWTPPPAGICSGKSPTRVSGSSGETATLEPDTYCNGLIINADTVVLNPGIYHIKNGPLRLTGNVDVLAEGVTLILSGSGAAIEASGQATLRIVSPNSGPTAGIAVAEDRTTDLNTISKFTGGSLLDIHGVIYLPNHDVELTGSGTLNKVSPYLQMVSNRLRVTGGGEVNVSFDDSIFALPQAIATSSVSKLVK